MLSIEITEQDIQDAQPNNFADPLARALNRTTGKEWRTEVYSHGVALANGRVWTADLSQDLSIDAGTTLALVAFDAGEPFQPRTATLA